MLQRRSNPVNGSVPDFAVSVLAGVVLVGSLPLLGVEVVGVLASFDGDVPVLGVLVVGVLVVGVLVVGVVGVWL